MLNTKFSPWPSFSEEEGNKVRDVLLSNKVNYWTGQECREFEKEFAAFADCDFAVAVANGTVALEMALRALGIGYGDEVVVTSRTFLASASAIMVLGAKPVFADINQDSQNIYADSIKKVLSPKTKAIICVHLAGWPCDMDPILALALEKNLFVVEDCAQAHGAKYKGKSVGSLGDVAAWSFCQDKIMSTGGEGGMITTNQEELWTKMWSYKDHGKSWNAVLDARKKPGFSFKWLHESLGSNLRMTEMQGAIGRIQLKKMPEWKKKRTLNAERILQAAKDSGIFRVPVEPEYIEHAWYKCYVFLKSDTLGKGWNQEMVLKAFAEEGIPAFSGSCSEIYKELVFQGSGSVPKIELSTAISLGRQSIMFLVHPTLQDEEVRDVCHAIAKIASKATKNKECLSQVVNAI